MCTIENLLTTLEGGYGATLLGSTQAAFSTALLALMAPGEHVLITSGERPSQARLSEHLRVRFGVEVDEVDTSDTDAVRAALKPNTRLIIVETPSHSGLKVTDLAEISRTARQAHALLMVDSTLAGPYVQSPLALGAHLVMHPLAHLIGESGQEGALLVARQGAVHKRIREMSRILGNRQELLRAPGLSTLALREERAQENAKEVAEWLMGHPQIQAVHHLSLETHPHHERARHQMRGPGPGVSFELKTGRKDALELLPRLPSLNPWVDTHGTLHLLVGFGDNQDLMEELDEGLKRLQRCSSVARDNE
ncbi:aminotransferase class V-fold PLP-dependent enzyme [Holophaga foetida]|uniref:aminotransferase class V-fold PLP-dependent enzyme n=1 Tax=Holophaga foetida TaxID=35839 RepID=UPI000247503A|nr:aminotransferase class V-fold PLP-dependent enzyme [Holophaga foetida]